MPRSNGSTGSTTAACWSRSATCRRPKQKRPTTGSWRSPPQSPPNSNKTASEEVGTVQNPSDADHVVLSLKRHLKAFGHAPQLYGADRGFFSEQNLASCARSGVSTACIPQRGGKKTPEREAFEKSAAFKKGQRFRAGIEGRISVLARGRGMKRCLAEGAERFELWVGAAVLANNLMVIASLLTKRSPRRRRDARINPDARTNAAAAQSD